MNATEVCTQNYVSLQCGLKNTASHMAMTQQINWPEAVGDRPELGPEQFFSPINGQEEKHKKVKNFSL